MVTKKERADVLFCTFIYLPYAFVGLKLGLTEKQVWNKVHFMRRTGKTVGGMTIDEWKSYTPTGEDKSVTLDYGRDLEPSDYVDSEGGEACMSVFRAEKKRNVDSEACRRECAMRETDLITNRWLNENDGEKEMVWPERYATALVSSCKEQGSDYPEIDRFFKNAMRKVAV